ncbi:Cof-type HAD-IIB family hydrolase [Maribacter sp. BPC-D8]|uniref:Cof-type HAD-IIB family hydrolase n=1 Tax=Maribacter sp. BPC-D8 TaxID=3053613 RepID=UPI002B479903|nr:Cof-type HAD-IIB family hydrolase [Maribacter sp. BPC-D8]WRI29804.1 Cof-type HAD-IIB family hydrolase [Maribacter sp. BPC-D8]
MKYKILCSDLDGTLLSTKSDVSLNAIEQIRKIKNETKIILVSARMPSAMWYIQEDLGITDQPIICYNGALVLSGNKELNSVFIPIDILNTIYELCAELEADLGLYYSNEWYVPKTSLRVEKEIKYTKSNPVFQDTEQTLQNWQERKIGAHKIMLMCTKTSADLLMPILQEKLGDSLNLYRSNDTLIEIAPESVSKLSAIKLLMQEHELLSDIIAFGDNYNDIEMLENVGCGVAVANARDEVKAISNYITLENTADGVAHYIANNLVY